MSFSSVNSKNIDNVNSLDALEVGDLEVSNDLIVDGNVGIGTDAPANILHIFDTNAGTTALVKIENTGANEDSALCFSNDNKTYTIGIDGDVGDRFKISDGAALGTNDRFTVDTNGLIGIGTGTPGNLFHIFDTDAGTTPLIKIENSGTDENASLLFTNDANSWTIGADGGDSDKFKISDSAALGTTDRFIIDTSGRVGIQTNIPVHNLHIFDTDAGTLPMLRLQNTGTNEDASIRISNDAQDFTIGVDGSDGDKFKISDGETVGSTDRLVIGVTGNTGLSVSDPDEIFHMDGRIHLEEATAPSSTTDKLYNVSGVLTWNGVDISSPPAASGFANFVEENVNNLGLGSGALVSNTEDSGNENTAVGVTAMTANTTGDQNTAVGSRSLLTNITGSHNTAIGYTALTLSTSDQNTAVGSEASAALTTGDSNVAVGRAALKTNSTGFSNTAVGINALLLNTASDNTAVGSQALATVDSGTRNVAIGADALELLDTNGDCTAVGYQALLLNTGASNTAVGSRSLDANTTGERHVAMGTQALGTITTGDDCTAIGYFALNVNTGSGNTAVGSESLLSNTTGARNVAIGVSASGTTTGNNDNTSIGYSALGNATGGNSNTAIGSGAMNGMSTGSENVAIGFNALGASTSALSTVAIGFEAGIAITTGNGNTAIGRDTLQAVTTQSFNVAIGQGALQDCTSSDNIVIGVGAGDKITSGTRNTVVGRAGLDAVLTGNDNTSIGHNALSAYTGSFNTAVGSTALLVSTGGENVGIGHAALLGLTSGASSTAIGYRAGSGMTTSSRSVFIGASTGGGNAGGDNVGIGASVMTAGSGGKNTGVGSQCLTSLTTGASNTAIGQNSLDGITIGNSNTCLGLDAGCALATNDSFNILINHDGVAGNDGTVRIGNTSHGQYQIMGATDTDENFTVLGSAGKSAGGTTWVSTSDERVKTDIVSKDIDECLEKINKLRLVNYKYQPWYENNCNFKQCDNKYTGFIAQEVGTVYDDVIGVSDNDSHFWDIELGVTHTIPNMQKMKYIDHIWSDGIAAIQALTKRQERIIRRLERLEDN